MGDVTEPFIIPKGMLPCFPELVTEGERHLPMYGDFFPTESRPPLIVAKTYAEIRQLATEMLEATDWLPMHGVTIENLAESQANEDDFRMHDSRGTAALRD